VTTAPRVLIMTGEWPVPGRPNQPSIARRHADALHAAGVPVEIFAFRAGRNPYDYAEAWTRLRPRLNGARYDVLHAHFTQSGLLALPKRLPLVVTLRDSDLGMDRPASRIGRLRALAGRILARRADAVIVPSEELRARVPNASRVHVIPAELDEQALTARLLGVYGSVC
jgi:hypothetical protein